MPSEFAHGKVALAGAAGAWQLRTKQGDRALVAPTTVEASPLVEDLQAADLLLKEAAFAAHAKSDAACQHASSSSSSSIDEVTNEGTGSDAEAGWETESSNDEEGLPHVKTTSLDELKWRRKKEAIGVVCKVVRYNAGICVRDDLVGLAHNDSGTVVVTRLRQPGVAASAGVRVGDKLAYLGRQPATEYTPHALASRLKRLQGPVELMFLGFAHEHCTEVRVHHERSSWPGVFHIPGLDCDNDDDNDDQQKDCGGCPRKKEAQSASPPSSSSSCSSSPARLPEELQRASTDFPQPPSWTQDPRSAGFEWVDPDDDVLESEDPLGLGIGWIAEERTHGEAGVL
mmetsp:Transcript_98610/g.205590  ORF Transcript_98610/g.205590 Transcript_98610/m.205590 type:complete len:342 (-) Transcript_98610:423-1448(-)